MQGPLVGNGLIGIGHTLHDSAHNKMAVGDYLLEAFTHLHIPLET